MYNDPSHELFFHNPLTKNIPQLGTLFNTDAGRYISKGQVEGTVPNPIPQVCRDLVVFFVQPKRYDSDVLLFLPQLRELIFHPHSSGIVSTEATALGDPLLLGLQELAQKRPPDPVTYLATFLYNYANRADRDYAKPPPSESESASNILSGGESTEKRTSDCEDADADDVTRIPGVGESSFSTATRDEFGQTALHFAAVREHSRGALLQLLVDADLNVALRDELYRTARDVALQASLPENMADIDKWVLTMAARGETDKLVELLLEGYDHILDVRESTENGIIEVAKARSQQNTVSFLNSIEEFEERRERIHHAIRTGNTAQAIEMLSPADTRSQLLAIAKNASSRCALHLAVLHQNQELVRHLATNFPATVAVGDNLERTALHYAMAVESVEQLSQILTSAGAKRVPKDLKGRQPSYYFMNKTDIRRLQDEENSLKMNS